MAIVLSVELWVCICMIDVLIAQHLEKKHLFWPMGKFKCFCQAEYNLIATPLFVPTRTRNFLRCRKHTQACLLWIMNADMNGLTPYFANSYRGDLEDGTKSASLLGKEWYLEWAKTKSKRAREGKDPWGEDENKNR